MREVESVVLGFLSQVESAREISTWKALHYSLKMKNCSENSSVERKTDS
jgi:hypothetical protein